MMDSVQEDRPELDEEEDGLEADTIGYQDGVEIYGEEGVSEGDWKSFHEHEEEDDYEEDKERRREYEGDEREGVDGTNEDDEGDYQENFAYRDTSVYANEYASDGEDVEGFGEGHSEDDVHEGVEDEEGQYEDRFQREGERIVEEVGDEDEEEDRDGVEEYVLDHNHRLEGRLEAADYDPEDDENGELGVEGEELEEVEIYKEYYRRRAHLQEGEGEEDYEDEQDYGTDYLIQAPGRQAEDEEASDLEPGENEGEEIEVEGEEEEELEKEGEEDLEDEDENETDVPSFGLKRKISRDDELERNQRVRQL